MRESVLVCVEIHMRGEGGKDGFGGGLVATSSGPLTMRVKL